ncbi:MAG TPA: L,D-transpeptidase [Solirubrobacterales bacterium]|nr:L,D-transpeptidase [Solirubrobacterales bacterium]
MKIPGIGGWISALRRYPVRGAVLLALVCAAALIAASDGGDRQGEARAARAADGGDLLDWLRALGQLPEPDDAATRRVPGPSFEIARVRDGARVVLHRRPEGGAIANLGDTTGFGSPRHFWIARRTPGWLGVSVPKLPNGELGWIRDDPIALELMRSPYFIEADTSERTLELHYGKRILERFSVTVGAPGSPTPPGAYAVTDGVVGKAVGRYYGCCVLALSGHQPNLPSDWIGGNRIAIHGTPGTVGLAASTGCLRATDLDMVSLFARVPLGAPVFIRR